MKENIDLTLNRDFRKTNERHFGRNFILEPIGKIPWKTIFNSSQRINYKETFFTGNNKDRKLKLRNKSYENMEDICERCESKILPWNRVYMLCSKCDEELELEVRNNRYWFLNIK
jgi:hypothetical protein